MDIVYKIYRPIICKINFFFLQYCLLDLLVGVVQPSVLWKVATLIRPVFKAVLSTPKMSDIKYLKTTTATLTIRRVNIGYVILVNSC